MKPKLNSTRWQALKDIEACGQKVFTSLECGVHGAALYSLEKCGWIERTELPDDLPWQTDTQGNYWWLTKEGEHVLKILPTTKPRN
jgi:hypothetical protein